jgi:hypothetical protein
MEDAVKLLLAVLGGMLAVVLGVAVIASGPSSDSQPSALATGEIPPNLLPRYIDAASTCVGLPWQVLAAIGFIESRHGEGRVDPATGDISPPILGPALDGTNGTARIADPSAPDGWMHAQGPMQFLPTTWARWGRLAPDRPAGAKPSIENAWDAIYSAAAYLCGGRDKIGSLDNSILSYNHSSAYLRAVMDKATEYGFAGVVSVSVSVVGGMTCPVIGPVSFTDSWGAPRSGGRTHKGNDLIAPYATPLVAVENGVIDQVTDTDIGLGGISIWLRGNSGTRYYYAHDSRNVGNVGQRVTVGTVIAYLGQTGNARDSVPQLHFEIHPGGGAAVDPYPTLLRVCLERR